MTLTTQKKSYLKIYFPKYKQEAKERMLRIQKSFTITVKLEMDNFDISISDLARELNVDRRTVAYILDNSLPCSLEYLFQIEAAMNALLENKQIKVNISISTIC